MTIDRRGVLIAATAALAAGPALLRPALAAPRVNDMAPDFTATDSQGRPISLSSFKGKTVVLEWAHIDCPYVRKHYGSGSMQSLQQEAAAQGVQWLLVSSMAPGKRGYVDGIEANAWVDTQKAKPTAFVVDPKGAIAELYDVHVALSMFVLDRSGRVVYSGAIDDRPTANPKDIAGARNYVRGALAAVASGAAVTPAVTRPYGCFAR